MKNKCRIKKDDKVKVIAGKDRGKIGKVIKIVRKNNRLIVEHVNIVKKHTKASARNDRQGIVEQEAPIHLSNVMLICNKCMSPARIGIRCLEDGNRMRVCKKCSEIIDG